MPKCGPCEGAARRIDWAAREHSSSFTHMLYVTLLSRSQTSGPAHTHTLTHANTLWVRGSYLSYVIALILFFFLSSNSLQRAFLLSWSLLLLIMYILIYNYLFASLILAPLDSDKNDLSQARRESVSFSCYFY